MDQLPTLDNIKTDLLQFEKLIFELRNNNADTYDSSLKIPLWRELNVKDFADDLASTATRFNGRVRLLEQPNDIIDDERINKKAIVAIGKQLIVFVAVYQNNVTKSKLGEKLLQGLRQIDTVLKNYSRSDNISGYTPPNPGKR